MKNILFALLSIALTLGSPLLYAGENLIENEKSLPLPFASQPNLSRGYIDLPVSNPEAVGKADAFSLEMQCDHPEVIGSFTLYFQSGKGWYAHSLRKPVHLAGNPNAFQLLAVRDHFIQEDNPGPWEKAHTVRISAWRGTNKDGELRIKSLRAKFFSILTVIPKAKGDAQEAARLLEMMNRIGIETGTVAENDLDETCLKDRKLVFLPNNPGLSQPSIQLLRNYLERGGQLLAFYQLPAELMQALGFRPATYLKSPQGDAAFAEVQFEAQGPGKEIFGETASFSQQSWNINTTKPDPQAQAVRPEIIAWWYDKAGRKTDHAAMLLSDRGAFFSHIVTRDDREKKEAFLGTLFAHYDHSLIRKQLDKAWKSLFSIGDLRSITPAERSALTRRYLSELKRRGFELDAVFFNDLEKENMQVPLSVRWKTLLQTLHAMRETEIRHYCSTVTSRSPEFRAWWEHAGTGAYPGDWDRTMREIAATGFNAVIPNMLWGGSACYASDILPRDAVFAQYGDQIEQAVQAGKKHGVEVHVWKVNFRLSRAPQTFLEAMRKEGRLQKMSDGTEVDWLCPSHQENLQLECDSLCEVVRKYDVAGIHFDYIRYPNDRHCFCEGCRKRFTESTKCLVKKWPADVRHGGPHQEAYLRWRCGNITRLVEKVHREAKSIRADVLISAAVFRDYPEVLRTIGQDWKLWAERGYLDFLCPMNYTNSLDQFETWTNKQLPLVGKVPLYPGIGAASSNSSLSPDEVVAQIEIARKAGAGGFVIFNLNRSTIQKYPPLIHLGATRDKAVPHVNRP